MSFKRIALTLGLAIVEMAEFKDPSRRTPEALQTVKHYVGRQFGHKMGALNRYVAELPPKHSDRMALEILRRIYRHQIQSKIQPHWLSLREEAESLVFKRFPSGVVLDFFQRYLEAAVFLMAWADMHQKLRSGSMDIYFGLQHLYKKMNGDFPEKFTAWFETWLGVASTSLLDLTRLKETFDADDQYELQKFALRLKAYGFPPLILEALPDAETGIAGRPVVLYDGLPMEDGFSEIEALHAAGALPVIVFRDEDKTFVHNGLRLQIRIKRGIVRGPQGYYVHTFAEPLWTHYSGYDADMPNRYHTYYQRMSDDKDLAQRVLQAAGVPVPRAVWWRTPRTGADDRFRMNLREDYAHETLCFESCDSKLIRAELLRLRAQGFDCVAVKPNECDRGVGVRLGALSDARFLLDMSAHIAGLMEARYNVLIQERIEPPYFKIDGVAYDWNLRVFITRDADGRPKVAPMAVRYGPAGGPINISISARVMPFEALRAHLGLSPRAFAGLKKKIELTALATYEAMVPVMEKYADSRVATRIDWCGIDIMCARRGRKWLPYVIEYNGANAGAQWDLGSVAGDLTLATHEWAQGVLRRADDYRQRFEAEIKSSAADEWEKGLMLSTLLAGLDKDPDDLQTLKSVAKEALWSDDHALAETCLELLVKYRPWNVAYWEGLMGAQIHQSKFAQVFETSRAFVALHPQNSKAHFGLGAAYLHHGDFLLAKDTLSRATALAEDGSLKLLAATLLCKSVWFSEDWLDWDQCFDDWKKAYASDCGDVLDEMLQDMIAIAQDAFARDRNHPVGRSILQAIESDIMARCQHTDTPMKLVLLYHQCETLAEKEALVAAAVQRFPEHLPLHIVWMATLFRSGQRAEAEARFLALSAQDQQGIVAFNYSSELMFVGENDRAEAVLAEALRVHPDNILLLENLATCKTRKGDVPGMLAAWEQAHRQDPDKWQTHLKWIQVELKHGDSVRADAEAQDYMQRQAQNLPALWELFCRYLEDTEVSRMVAVWQRMASQINAQTVDVMIKAVPEAVAKLVRLGQQNLALDLLRVVDYSAPSGCTQVQEGLRILTETVTAPI